MLADARGHFPFEEIKALGYKGSLNQLYRYITQGRIEADRPAISPKRLALYLLTRPSQLNDEQRELLDTLAAWPDMTTIADLVRSFAALLTTATTNDDLLPGWITEARAEDLPHLHAHPQPHA